MITSKRVIIYRTETTQEEGDYEITHVYDFRTIAKVHIAGISNFHRYSQFIYLFIYLEDESSRAYVQFLLHIQSQRSNKQNAPVPTVTVNGIQYQQIFLRCDLHERAVRLARDIQRAKEIFEEEKLTYTSPDDEDDVNDDDISDEQQTEEEAVSTT